MVWLSEIYSRLNYGIGFGSGRKCSHGQQEEQDQPETHCFGGEERRGTLKAFQRGDDPVRWGGSEHQPSSSSKEI